MLTNNPKPSRNIIDLEVPKGQKLEVGQLYLQLFHGRKTPAQELNDWGEVGPCFGPLNYFQVTYMSHYRMGNDIDEQDLKIVEDLVEHKGMYYGDFSVFVAREDGSPSHGT